MGFSGCSSPWPHLDLSWCNPSPQLPAPQLRALLLCRELLHILKSPAPPLRGCRRAACPQGKTKRPKKQNTNILHPLSFCRDHQRDPFRRNSTRGQLRAEPRRAELSFFGSGVPAADKNPPLSEVEVQIAAPCKPLNYNLLPESSASTPNPILTLKEPSLCPLKSCSGERAEPCTSSSPCCEAHF